VRLYDYGVTEDGTFYYAMELLDGLDLETLVDRFGPVSPARAIYLLRQVCESLAEAHRAGLVHRDIKPSNLIACHVGGRVDFIKVVDFGLVRRLERPKDDVLVSDRNYLVGTPAFMAPELASSPDAVDGRADVYALGCVAYWLVTGRLVFEQPTIARTIADHVHEEPLPPSSKAERPVPEVFEQLILDCLAKDPEKRPQSADELYRRLGKLQVGRRWTQQQAHLWWHARLKELLPEGVTSSATPTWSSVQLPPLDQLSLPSRPAVPAAAPQPEAAPPPEQAPAPEPTPAAAPLRVAVPEPDPTLLLEDDDEPDFARWPAVPVSAISEIRIRARVRKYARARDESRAAKAAEAATPVEGEP
jgi:serine/threonine protein kinase